MRLFPCTHCGGVLYFENTSCAQCGRRLGFLADTRRLVALAPDGGERWTVAGEGGAWRFCANATELVCNWLVPAGTPARFCAACRHNLLIPDLSDPVAHARWAVLEAAKHRLIYSLLALRLPLSDRNEDPEHGLGFAFPAEEPRGPRVLTGHDNGLITVSLEEADDAVRTATQQRMGEAYRTPLGHFRHEVGHHYWDLLVQGGGRLDDFRALFGDERADYGASLRAHYGHPPSADWQGGFVSAYATSHPWEDFAETWAHYLHIVDTLEMAGAFGISVRPAIAMDRSMRAEIGPGLLSGASIGALIDAWLPLSLAMNGLNRSMGQKDPYPFVLSAQVIRKLGFVHGLMPR